MKKNINKLIAIGIGLSVIAGNAVPVLAADYKGSTTNVVAGAAVSNDDEVLTLDKVIEAAVNNDEQIKIYNSEKKYYKDMEDYYDEADDDNGEDQNDINLKDVEQSKSFRIDGVEYEITNLYNDILLLQKQIELQEIVVNNKSVETEQYRLQQKHGLITALKLEEYEQEFQREKDALQNYINQEKDSEKKLTSLTKINVSEYKLNDTLQFNPFRVNGNVDDYVEENVNIMLKYKKELIDSYKDQLDDMEDDDLNELDMPSESKFQIVTIDEDTGEEKKELNKTAYETACQQVLAGYKGYLELRKGAETGEYKLKAQEKQAKNQLRSAYSTILDMENQMNQTIAKINTTNKNLANIKLQYDLGLMTTYQYNKAVADCMQADIGLRQLANGYYKAATAFEKPWVASSGQ